MANIQKNFASIIALGGQNPQILNEDFLKINKIIPAQAPFDKKTNFISTPPFATIAFGPIEFLVEEQRFQIREAGLADWNETQIFDITIEYYKVLKYTPVKAVGINLNCQVDFENVEESIKFQKLLFPEKSKILEIISKDNIDISMRLRYPYSDNGRVLLTIDRSSQDNLQRQLSFNYEFDCIEGKETNWKMVQTELSHVNNIADYFSSIIDKLLEAI